jgi:hypothetical protein
MPKISRPGVRAMLLRDVQTARGKVGPAIGTGEGLAERYGGRSINQAIEIATGRFNTAEIIKWAIILLIIFGIGIWLVNVVRGFVIGVEQIGCGIWNFGNGQVCDINNPNSVITSTYFMWEAEWYLRCLFYICLALIIGLLIYQWAGWLMGKLLRADQEADKLKNWIYGTQYFERGSEEGFETRL